MLVIFRTFIFVFVTWLASCAPESLNITSDSTNGGAEAEEEDGFEEGKSSTPVSGASLLTYENAATSCSLDSEEGTSVSTCQALAGDTLADSVETGLTVTWDNPVDQSTGGVPTDLNCTFSDFKIIQTCTFPTPPIEFELGFNLNLSKKIGSRTQSKSISSQVAESIIHLGLLDAGGEHACSILADKTIKCWGRGIYGQLGTGNTAALGDGANEMGVNLNPIDLGAGLFPIQVSIGYFFSCALLNNFNLKCWGENDNGQLGKGNTNNHGDFPGQMGDNLNPVNLGSGRTAKFVSAGNDYTCAILDNNQLKCWGVNLGGVLGQGHANSIGDGAGEMGDNLPYVDLGSGKTAKYVAANHTTTCVILNDGSLKCFGQSSSGQAGYGDTQSRGDGAGEMGDNLPIVDLGSGKTALMVTRGQLHTCAILNDRTVKCWGYNGQGELGLEHTTQLGDGGGEMGDALAAVNLGTGRTALQISSGYSHTCAVLDNGSVKCWGNNASGELGQGHTNALGNAGGEMGDNLPAVDLGSGRTAREVYAGASFSCALLDDGSVKCWGGSSTGQLGQGNFNALGNQAGEMGDNLPPIDL